MRGMTDFDIYCECVKQDKIDNYDRVRRERDDAKKMISTLREGYKRILEMDGSDAEAFCLQILDHSKEYEDRAIIQQHVPPDN